MSAPTDPGMAGIAAANTALATVLVDEWARAGMEVAALAPGSRSTPLALALAGDGRIRLEVFLDERSASFFALGAAKASGRPSAVVCTSGTAAAELHPAVVEAAAARVALIVATADRPAELRDTGAPQTIDQSKLFGGTPRWFVDVPAPEAGATARLGRYWRSVGARAFAESLGPPAGPVHLNVAFREPLVAPPGGLSEPAAAAGRPGGRAWVTSRRAGAQPDAAVVETVAALVRERVRGLIVAGWGSGVGPDVVSRFAEAAGWPVLADPLSGLRTGPLAVSAYDALLRHPGFASGHRPEVVLALGAPLTSSVATVWLDDGVDRLLVDPDGAWLDPQRSAGTRLGVDAGPLLEAVLAALGSQARRRSSAWCSAWAAAEATARSVVDRALDADDAPFEGRVARDVVACLPDGATLVVGSSMPVRDVESFAAPRAGLRLLANRGANGIDGFVSTVLGVASAASGPVAALAGDLTFLHDAGGLLRAAARGLSATFVVVDNDGGGIFSFLPQAGRSPHFEELFGTPHGLDLVALAGVHGIPALRVESAAAVAPAVGDALAAGGVRMVLVRTDRAANVAGHRRLWAAVGEALELGASPGI